jgi:hypothetical protein
VETICSDGSYQDFNCSLRIENTHMNTLALLVSWNVWQQPIKINLILHVHPCKSLVARKSMLMGKHGINSALYAASVWEIMQIRMSKEVAGKYELFLHISSFKNIGVYLKFLSIQKDYFSTPYYTYAADAKRVMPTFLLSVVQRLDQLPDCCYLMRREI